MRRKQKTEYEEEYDDDELQQSSSDLEKMGGGLFVKAFPYLPPVHQGQYALIVSCVLQLFIIIVGFVSHHYKSPEFTCCNMWAILISLMFIAVQYPYYRDWTTRLGEEGAWHRANLFAPYFVLIFIFLLWLGATLSMAGHAIGAEFFELNLGALNGADWISFLVCSGCYVVIGWMCIATAYAHRNNLGAWLVQPNEEWDATVTLFEHPTPSEGSFHYRNTLGFIARVCRIETAATAADNLPRIITLTFTTCLPFYFFAMIAFFASAAFSMFSLGALLLGVGTMGMNFKYFLSAKNGESNDTREWNRKNMSYPLHSFFVVTIVYFFSMAGVFFKTGQNKSWGDMILEFDVTEGFLFAIGFILLLMFFASQTVLYLLHLKGWLAGGHSVEELAKLDVAAQQEMRRQRQDSDSESESEDRGNQRVGDDDAKWDPREEDEDLRSNGLPANSSSQFRINEPSRNKSKSKKSKRTKQPSPEPSDDSMMDSELDDDDSLVIDVDDE